VECARLWAKRAASLLKSGQCRRCADGGGRMQMLVIITENRAKSGVADANCVLQNRAKDRLQVAWQIRDNTQNLGRRVLLVQRLRQVLTSLRKMFSCVGQLAVPLLELRLQLDHRGPPRDRAGFRLRSYRTNPNWRSPFRPLTSHDPPRLRAPQAVGESLARPGGVRVTPFTISG
jgi:hypothetical protein